MSQFSEDLKFRIKYNSHTKKYTPERYVSKFWGLLKSWQPVPYYSNFYQEWWNTEWEYYSETEALLAIDYWKNKTPENAEIIYKELDK